MKIFLILVLLLLTYNNSFTFSSSQDKNIYSSYLRGLIYTQQGNYPLALEEFNKAKKLDPKSVQIRLKIAALLLRLDKLELAEKELSNIKKIDPKNIEASVALIFLYSYLKKDKELEEEYEHFLKNAVILMPDEDTLKGLAQFYFYKKKFTEALKIYETILEKNPNNVEAIFWKGYIYEEMNRRKDAIKIWKKGLEIQPSYPLILNALGYIYAEEGIFLDEAEMMIKKAIEKEPQNGAYLDSLGWVYFKKKDYVKAEEFLKAACSLISDPVVYEHLGDLYIELKEEEKAKKYYLEGLEKFPDNKNLKEKVKIYGGKDKIIKK